LSDAVTRAIAASEALIVLCSPAAAGSPWVAREIAAFRAAHPQAPLLLALVDGEPDAAFPPLARTGDNEPLAADLRAQGDGRRLGLLKLLAGLTGMPLGELVQRDAQRRLRRVTAVTVAALVALLALTALSVVAIRARHEAEQRRQAAEGLVEFMQTDLRERLKAVNRLDVLTAANRRALAYYAAQDLADLPPAALAQRARILHAIGEDDLDRKDDMAAAAAFTEARRTTGALLARMPSDPEMIFTHAQSEFWIGDLAIKRRDLPGAEAAFQAYIALADRLVAVAPRDARSLQEVAFANGSLCSARYDMRRTDGLLDLCLRALRAMERVAAMRPGDAETLRGLANRHAWIADVYFHRLRDPAAARRHRDREAAIIEDLLRADPANAQLRRKRIWSQRALALIELETNAVARGETRLAAAIRDLAAIVAEDPANHSLAQTLGEMKQELREARTRDGDGR
jgi:MTH538 TIR-like domain (DUF1863)